MEPHWQLSKRRLGQKIQFLPKNVGKRAKWGGQKNNLMMPDGVKGLDKCVWAVF